MFDPFGLKEEMPAKEFGHNPAAPATAPDASRQKRLWAVLLVLDTVFLLIFGGTLAGMLYLRRSHPAPSGARPGDRRAEPKKAAPASTPAPVALTAAVPVPADAPPATPPKPEAASQPPGHQAPAAAKAPPVKGPLGSPGVLAPDLPRRQAAPSTPAGPAAAAPSADTTGKEAHPLPWYLAPISAPGMRSAPVRPKPVGKARVVEFTCDATNAHEVKLKGPFLVRSGGVKKMLKGSDGIWRATISLLPGNYRYMFVIDGVKSKPQAVKVESRLKTQ